MEWHHFHGSSRAIGQHIVEHSESHAGQRSSEMPHEIAKLILEHAGTFVEREEAIRTAIRLGMPLDEIEAYLDWLDVVQQREGTRAIDSDKARP